MLTHTNTYQNYSKENNTEQVPAGGALLGTLVSHDSSPRLLIHDH